MQEVLTKLETFTDEKTRHFLIGVTYYEIAIRHNIKEMYSKTLEHIEFVMQTEKSYSRPLAEMLVMSYFYLRSVDNIFKAMIVCAECQNNAELHCSANNISYVRTEYMKLTTQLEQSQQQVHELKQKIKELETEIEYAPDGVGYQKAKDEFDELAKQ